MCQVDLLQLTLNHHGWIQKRLLISQHLSPEIQTLGCLWTRTLHSQFFYLNQPSFTKIKYASFTFHEAVLLSQEVPSFLGSMMAFLEPAEQNFVSASGSF